MASKNQPNKQIQSNKKQSKAQKSTKATKTSKGKSLLRETIITLIYAFVAATITLTVAGAD